MNTQDSSSGSNVIRFRVGGLFVAPVFLTLAAGFVLGLDFAEVPSAATPKLNKAALTTGPARKAVATDPPVIFLNEFDRTCMECHRTFESPDPRVTKLDQHRHIKLNHGINTHCYDCHHFEDRNYLTLKDGAKLPFTELVKLCAQCHGPIYRDWKNGLHGKRLGYWDDKLGERKPLLCAGCHDPHWPSRPAMLGLRPLPGPNTLRMGEPSEHHAVERDPLLRALHGSNKDH